MQKDFKTAVFGGGCFWCFEAAFSRLIGVNSVQSGYAGGTTENPTYEQVCSGSTGHAEVVEVEYYPKVISYGDLLDVFFTVHDPTQLNRQGNDVGTQYRSVVFYVDEEQKEETLKRIKELEEENVFDGDIVTEVRPLEKFFRAENYHNDYYDKNTTQPYCQAVISPKLGKLRSKFSKFLKEDN